MTAVPKARWGVRLRGIGRSGGGRGGSLFKNV